MRLYETWGEILRRACACVPVNQGGEPGAREAPSPLHPTALLLLLHRDETRRDGKCIAMSAHEVASSCMLHISKGGGHRTLLLPAACVPAEIQRRRSSGPGEITVSAAARRRSHAGLTHRPGGATRPQGVTEQRPRQPREGRKKTLFCSGGMSPFPEWSFRSRII